MEIYERLRALQQEDDIPPHVRLDQNHHSSIIQERRMRGGLKKGLAGGFVLATALGHIQSGIPGHGLGGIKASITGVDVIGRNRTVMIAHIEDEEGKLAKQADVAQRTLGALNLRLNFDRKPHIRLGESEPGLSETERRHVIHTVVDTITDIDLELLPIMVEHDGKRIALGESKLIDAPLDY